MRLEMKLVWCVFPARFAVPVSERRRYQHNSIFPAGRLFHTQRWSLAPFVSRSRVWISSSPLMGSQSTMGAVTWPDVAARRQIRSNGPANPSVFRADAQKLLAPRG